MNKIGLDIDETLAETIKCSVYPFVNQKYGTNFQFETTTCYKDVFGDLIKEGGEPISGEQKIALFNSAILLDRGRNEIETVEGSVEKILKLSDNFELLTVSARQESLTEYTSEWLIQHYQNKITKMLFSNSYYGGNKTKSDICEEHGIDVMFEDNMDEAYELAKNGVHTFLLRRPWNEQRKETHKNINKIDSWEDLQL